ncbi:Uncharacterised protein [Serratia grimesii]|nr:Uncharacterised protein [Serratia grimesii]
MRFDGANGTRGWGVDGHGAATTHGQRLTFKYPITRFDAQLAFRPQMLLKRDNKSIRQWSKTQRHAAGQGLHFRWVDPAVEIPNPVFFKGGEQIKHVAPRESLAPGSSSYPTSSWR